ncbi:MAG: amidohydrolase family protein [Vicinamibacterales bacterium]
MASLLVRAAWVCPVAAPPLGDGWVLVADGRIAAVGCGHDAPTADRVETLGDVALLPGLVNAHTHLELSWLSGLVPPAADFLTWVGVLMRRRTRFESADDAVAMAALRGALDEACATGTVAIGDVSNALVSPPVLRERDVPAVVFHEVFGFRDADGRTAAAAAAARAAAASGGSVRVVPAPHAPFSVSAELFAALRDETRRLPKPITTVHAGESPEELQLLTTGAGPWRERLQALGAWRDDWRPPGCGPGDYLCDLGVLGPGALAVHAVQFTDAELARLAAADVTVVTCPRSNVWVGVGPPPVARFVASGVRVALGTDSLASAPDLNLFAELATLHDIAPEVPARRLLAMATRGGAEALQLGDRLGALTPGRDARLVAVTLPAGTADPEAALVGGITADRIRRVPTTAAMTVS